MTVQVSLSAPMTKFVAQKVANGEFSTPEDVIQAGLESLFERDVSAADLRRLLREGERSIARYGTMDGDRALLRRRGQRRRPSGSAG